MTPALPTISRVAGSAPYPSGFSRNGLLRPFARIRYQLLGGLLVAVLLPASLRNQFVLSFGGGGSLENTVAGTAAAMVAGAYVLRRMLPYPGVQAISFVLPTFAASYL